jgi:hypothetical protein
MSVRNNGQFQPLIFATASHPTLLSLYNTTPYHTLTSLKTVPPNSYLHKIIHLLTLTLTNTYNHQNYKYIHSHIFIHIHTYTLTLFHIYTPPHIHSSHPLPFLIITLSQHTFTLTANVIQFYKQSYAYLLCHVFCIISAYMPS